MASAPLAYTGERYVPDAFAMSHRMSQEHVNRYVWAAGYLRPDLAVLGHARILDIPCGEGYGANILAAQIPNATIHGMDIDNDTINHAKTRYARDDEFRLVDFHRKDMRELRAKEAYDAIVCFEGIEHVVECELVAQNLCAALKPGGTVIVSTPRKGGPGGGSEFHPRELTRDELIGMFHPFLSEVEVFGQELRVTDCLPDDNARFYVLVGRK